VLDFIVGANSLLIFLLYFFLLAPSSPIAGPSQLKRIAEVVIPSSELSPVITGNDFRYNLVIFLIFTGPF
jgi:hypothetical protein